MTGFPTLILFDDGRPVGQHVGMADMPALLRYAGVRSGGAGAVATVAAAAPAAPADMELILSGAACCRGACVRARRDVCVFLADMPGLGVCVCVWRAERAQAGLLEEIGALRRELAALPGGGGAAGGHVDAIQAIVSASSKLL